MTIHSCLSAEPPSLASLKQHPLEKSQNLPPLLPSYPVPLHLLEHHVNDQDLRHVKEKHARIVQERLIDEANEVKLAEEFENVQEMQKEGSETAETSAPVSGSSLDSSQHLQNLVKCPDISSSSLTPILQLIAFTNIIESMAQRHYGVLRLLMASGMGDLVERQVIWDTELTEFLVRRVEKMFVRESESVLAGLNETQLLQLCEWQEAIATDMNIEEQFDEREMPQYVRNIVTGTDLPTAEPSTCTPYQLFQILWTLTNVVAADTTSAWQCLQIGTALVHIVKAEKNLKLVEQACWLLGNITAKGAHFQAFFRELKLVETLLERIDSQYDELRARDPGLKTIFWLLTFLFHQKAGVNLDHLQRLTTHIVNVLEDATIGSDTKKEVVNCFRSVSTNDDEKVIDFFFNTGLLQSMIRIVSDAKMHIDDREYTKVIRSCLFVLGNIVSHCTSHYTELLVEWGLVDALVTLVNFSTDASPLPAHIKDILWILSNMVTDSTKACITLWNHATISQLLVKCLKVEGKIRTQASHVLRNSLHKNLSMKRHVHHQFVAPLVETMYLEKSLEERKTYLKYLEQTLRLNSSMKKNSLPMKELLANDLTLLSKLDTLQHVKYYPLSLKVREMLHKYVDPYLLELE